MNQNGYYYIHNESAPDESLVQYLESFLEVELARVPFYLFNLGEPPTTLQESCEAFMLHGINLDVNLLSHFESAQNAFLQGPIFTCIQPTDGGKVLRRSHPSRNGISIWRTLRGSAIFKVYPGTHHLQTMPDLHRIRATEIRISSNQVLVTHGGLWIEQIICPSPLMWVGFSTDIIGLHLDMISLPFIASAYGATVQLLSQPPPTPEAIYEQNHYSPPMNISRLSGSNRQETAQTLLNLAIENNKETTNFIAEIGDPTRIILAEFGSLDDPITPYLTLPVQDIRKCYLRTIVVRLLSMRYHLSHPGSITDFIQHEGLKNTPQIIKVIKYGRKVYSLELKLQKPSIWLAFMCLLPRFERLPFSEVSPLADLLLSGEYPAVIDTAPNRSQIMSQSVLLLVRLLDAKKENMAIRDIVHA